MNEKTGGSVVAATLALIALLIGGPGGTLFAGVFGIAGGALFLFGLFEDTGF